MKVVKISLIIFFNTTFLGLTGILAIYFYGKSSFGVLDTIHGEWGYPFLKNQEFTFQGTEITVKINDNLFKDNPYARKEGSKHILFMGGSNTFGEEIKEEESLEAILSQDEALRDYRPYILAYPGWGPNNILEYVRHVGLKKEIKEEEGIAFYQVIEDHLSRVCGFEHYFSWSHGKSPHYTLEHGNLIHQGLWQDSWKFKQYLFKTGLRELFPKKKKRQNIFYPYECLQLFVKVVVELKNEYLKTFPQGRFHVFVLPVSVRSVQDYLLMMKTSSMMKDAGVEVSMANEAFGLIMKEKKKNFKEFLNRTMHVNAKFYEAMLPYYRKLTLGELED